MRRLALLALAPVLAIGLVACSDSKTPTASDIKDGYNAAFQERFDTMKAAGMPVGDKIQMEVTDVFDAQCQEIGESSAACNFKMSGNMVGMKMDREPVSMRFVKKDGDWKPVGAIF